MPHPRRKPRHPPGGWSHLRGNLITIVTPFPGVTIPLVRGRFRDDLSRSVIGTVGRGRRIHADPPCRIFACGRWRFERWRSRRVPLLLAVAVGVLGLIGLLDPAATAIADGGGGALPSCTRSTAASRSRAPGSK